MTKTKLIFIGLAVALVGFLFAGSASAQEGEQTLTADPSAVPEAGTYDITISAEGFTLSSVNLAICSVGDPSLLDGAGPLMQYCGGFGNSVDIADDGTYSTTLEGVEITEDGVSILMFELADPPRNSASVAVNIGEPMDDMLADTGVETSVLVIIGAGIALAGLMVFGLSRRLRTL